MILQLTHLQSLEGCTGLRPLRLFAMSLGECSSSIAPVSSVGEATTASLVTVYMPLDNAIHTITGSSGTHRVPTLLPAETSGQRTLMAPSPL